MWTSLCLATWMSDRVGSVTVMIAIRARVAMALRTINFMAPLCLSILLAGCDVMAPSSQPPASPGPVVVTLRVADAEEYRIRLIDPEDIAVAQRLLAGEAAPRIPNGLVVRDDSEVNVGYSWHIDPESVEFVDATIEVCDGRPSDVENRVITSDRYCPWSAEVVAIAPAEAP